MQVPKSLAVAATAIGIAGGSYGIASAANGGSSTATTTPTATPSQTRRLPVRRARRNRSATSVPTRLCSPATRSPR